MKGQPSGELIYLIVSHFICLLLNNLLLHSTTHFHRIRDFKAQYPLGKVFTKYFLAINFVTRKPSSTCLTDKTI